MLPAHPIDAAEAIARAHQFNLREMPQVGGNYLPVMVIGRTAHVSGQVPRIGSTVVVTGRVGDTVSLDEAQRAARICTLRVLAILEQACGLERVERVLRLNVFVQSAPDFTQQSEVADAASNLLAQVFGPAGAHARTSVGVMQLPKNASVELDMTVALRPGPEVGGG